MLIGLLEPTAGEVRVDGVDVRVNPREVRDRIGYMGQKVSLYQGLTIRENAEFYAGLFGIDGDLRARRWDELRERFALAEAEGERPENLSAGVRQRAGLALATLHQPRILFLDEPTAGVDVASRDLFWDRIQDEADSGRTVFVTTHFLEEADYCDRVSFIADGRLVADATPESLRAAWSGGYELETRAAIGPEAAAGLRAAGFRDEPRAEGGVAWRAASLGASELAAFAAAVGPAAAGGVRVHQPAMNDVFRNVVTAQSAPAETAP
jgi:ABC-2 type transport system ATP-binding protein